MLTVCTGWSPTGWNQYGKRFAETFDQFWTRDVRLVVYGEEPRELPNARGRIVEFHSLLEIPALCRFIIDHQMSLRAHGREWMPQHEWKPRALMAGYNWRYDAVKFSRQAFIPLQVLLTCTEGDYLAWLDGDVVTHAPVAERFITDLLPPDKDVAFLGRGRKHPEIGFQLYRVNASTMKMLKLFRAIYETHQVFDFPEWHSAYIWNEALQRTIPTDRQRDLTPGGSGHVWHESPLRFWTDHLKGDRKGKDRSPEAR